MVSNKQSFPSWLLIGALLVFGIVSCGKPSSGDAESDSSDRVTTQSGHSHATASETCFICDDTKRESGRLWCKEHARYEDRCWECQPQLEEKDRLFCEEHSLYEDECFLCHPELEIETDQPMNSKVERAAGPGDLFCFEHRVPEVECGICQPQRAATLEPGHELKVRFDSSRSATKAGIATVLARTSTVQASLSAYCEVSYDQNSLVRITPLADGIVSKVLVDLGQDVEVGDALIELNSAEVARAKAAFVSAVVDLDLKEAASQREERLAKKNISSEKEVQEADAAHQTAQLVLDETRQRLVNYGFNLEDIAAIERNRDTSALLVVRAPFDGTLIDRDVVLGQAARPGDTLFSLADLGSMWLSLSLPTDVSGLIRIGLEVEADFPSLATSFRGEVTWVDTAIDEKSRMLRARAVVRNADRELRSGMFGDARIFISDELSSVDVPKEAIQVFEGHPYVFVKLEDDLFSLRRIVTVERPSRTMASVVEGLRADELVVATGGFTVMSEFLKSRLGAGCVDD
jgi:membrane fusion protein, heavy metal efflux system